MSRGMRENIREMSEKDVELVRASFEEFAATRNVPPDRFTDDFVWDMSTYEGWPERQQYPGVAGLVEFIADWESVWDEWRNDPEQYLDAGEGRVVIVLTQHGTSRSSGLELDMRFAHVWTLRGGCVERIEAYSSPEAAMEAVGLAGK